MSHVLEHLDYQTEVTRALREFRRVLVPGGKLMIGVPNLETLAHLLIAPFFSVDSKYHVMRMMFGGQTDKHDYHKSGFTYVFLYSFLKAEGFDRIRQVETFGLFQDTTELKYNGVPVSLNVEAFRSA